MPDDEDMAWLHDELDLCAERARDRGMTPAEFMMGLLAYTRELADQYAEVDVDG